FLFAYSFFCFFFFFFFFSSRRRHTRWPRDWSSDVCSSDLHLVHLWIIARSRRVRALGRRARLPRARLRRRAAGAPRRLSPGVRRSEERRVGKEWRSRWWREH